MHYGMFSVMLGQQSPNPLSLDITNEMSKCHSCPTEVSVITWENLCVLGSVEDVHDCTQS